MYDGEHQIKHFDDLFKLAGLEKNQYTLRDRWHDSNKNFGVKLLTELEQLMLETNQKYQ